MQCSSDIDKRSWFLIHERNRVELRGNINNHTRADIYVGRETFRLKDSLDNRSWVDVYVDRDTS